MVNNMYFDIIKETLTKMIENRVRDYKDHEDKIKELENNIERLKVSQVEAAENGKDKEYVLLEGKIAVAEAALKREHDKIVHIVPADAVEEIHSDINKVYTKEIGSRARKILKMADAILKTYDEMILIGDELEETIYLFDDLAENDKSKFARGEIYAIERAKRYAEKAINPFIEGIGENSIRGWAYYFNYVEGDELENTTDYTCTDEADHDGVADGDEIGRSGSLEDELTELTE